MEKIGGSVKIGKIAVTGTLSAGKSTVCELLKARGAYVIKADDIVHDLLSRDLPTIQKIKEVFGDDVITQGKVDRKALANLVFTDPERLTSLETILHPKVLKVIQEAYKAAQDEPFFVVEFPLLFEIGFDSWFDEILFVTADPKICMERFIGKGFSEEQFKRRNERFAPEAEKKAKSTSVIVNNGSLESLTQEIEKWIKKTNKKNR